MLILIIMEIVVIVFDLMQVHNFHCHFLNAGQMLIFLVWAIVSKGILITEKDILIPGKGSIDGLGDHIITTEAKYSVNITERKLNQERNLIESTLQCGQQLFV